MVLCKLYDLNRVPGVMRKSEKPQIPRINLIYCGIPEKVEIVNQ